MAAVDTALAPLAGGKDAAPKLKVYQRKVDFAVTGLAAGDWFPLFKTDPGDIVVGGTVIVNGGTTGGDEDFTLGYTGATTVLRTATPVDTDAVLPLTAATYGVVVDDKTINLYMTVDAADVGTVTVTLLVLKASDLAG